VVVAFPNADVPSLLLTIVLSITTQYRTHNSHGPWTSKRAAPYDPYLPRGGSSTGAAGAGTQTGGNAKTAAIQRQIDDTVGIMRDNITKVAERGENLNSLQDKTGECPPLGHSALKPGTVVARIYADLFSCVYSLQYIEAVLW